MAKNIWLGIILILIGAIWLLKNINVVPFSLIEMFFDSLGKLWPLLLIGVGLSLILKKNQTIKLIIWLIILAAIILYGLLTFYNFPA
ncbi:MAG: hypothetical protein GX091_00050 [Peptococcaceae bacterium]|nr:hypothetical protein [Peptococcaceae bacterium]